MSAPLSGSGPAIDPSDGVVFPCSSAQRRCWFIDVIRPGAPTLNIALRWEIGGTFSAPAIEEAFRQIIGRHEILRTRFTERDGEPMQVVMPTSPFRLSEIDLSFVPQDQRLDEAMALAHREARVPFALDRLPLIRVTMIRLAPDHAFLLITVHQIAFDGRSIHLLALEFGTIVAALDAQQKPQLPDLPLQYGDYAEWQAACFATHGFARQIAFWKGRLADAPYFEVSPDMPRPQVPSYRGEIISQILPDALGIAMEENARAHRVSLFSFTATMTVAVLHKLTGCTDVVFATQVGGREDPDLEALIGVFINNLVLRVDASGDPSIQTLVQRTSTAVQDALAHQEMPFDKLVEILNPPRDPSRTPLISVSFTVLHNVMPSGAFGRLDLQGRPSLSPGSLYDLNFFLVRWPSGWRLAMEFNPDLFTRESADDILASWRKALDWIATNPEAALSSLDVPRREPFRPDPQAAGLAAIEAALRAHPLVADAAAVARGEGEVNAYVVPSGDSRIPLETLPRRLLADLAASLPAFKLSVMLAIPRGPNGYVDIAALPMPYCFDDPADGPDAIEEVVREIWQDVLNLGRIPSDGNFFVLGGHSLLALRMITRVGQRLNCKPDVLALFRTPTVREFARHVAKIHIPVPEWNRVEIQSKGSKTPIIAINNTVTYYNLARKIGLDRPFLGIQLFDPTSPRVLEDRGMAEIAAEYVTLIRKAHPKGPYILLGLCVAGAVAFEAARQLRTAGEEVALVIVADSWAPGFRQKLPLLARLRPRWAYRVHAARYNLARLRRGETSLAHVLQTYRLVRLSRVLHLAHRLGLIEALPEGRDDWGNRWFLGHLEAARRAYAPDPADFDILVLRSDEVNVRYTDVHLGWRTLTTGAVAVHRAPGWHTEMFQAVGADGISRVLRPMLDAREFSTGSRTDVAPTAMV